MKPLANPVVTLGCSLLVFAVGAVFWGTIAYIALHFIGKYW